MPDNECDKSFAQNNDGLETTRPLHIITHYPGSDTINMQSPGRPTSLGICLSSSQNIPEFKGCSLSVRTAISQDNGNQSWAVRSVDTYEFEKLLGQLGNNGSTPVTPTSFLNPKNITEDQEMFADNFSRTLNKVKAEQEGWSTSVDTVLNNNGYSKLSRNNVPVSSLSDNTASGSDVNSTLIACSPTNTISTTSHRHQSEGNSFLTKYSTDMTQIDVGDSRQLTSNQLPESVVCSPDLTDKPIILSSKLSNPIPNKNQTQSSTLRNNSNNEQTNCSTSDPFQLAYYPTLSTSPSRTVNETHWVSGLPTILSIASGLKQAAAAAAAATAVAPTTTSITTTNITTSDTITTTTNCSTDNFDPIATTTTSLSPSSNGFVEQSYLNGTLVAANEDEISQQTMPSELHSVGLMDGRIPHVLVRYAMQDTDELHNRSSTQMAHHQHHNQQQQHDDLIHSLPNSTSNSTNNISSHVGHSSTNLARLENSNFGIREALSELYSAVCPTITSTRPMVEEECKANLSHNSSCTSRHQSFDHIYSNMSGCFNLPLSESNEKPLLLQSNTDFSTSSHHNNHPPQQSRQQPHPHQHHLMTSVQPVCDILLDSPSFTNICTSSTNPNGEEVLHNQILNLAPIPTFLCSTTTTTSSAYEMNRDLGGLLSSTGTLSSSSSSSAGSSSCPSSVPTAAIDLTPILQTGANTSMCSLNQYSNNPLSVTSATTKRSKRFLTSTSTTSNNSVTTNATVNSTKKSRIVFSDNSNAPNVTSTQPMSAIRTKLCDNQNNPSDVLVNDHQLKVDKSGHVFNSHRLPQPHSDQTNVLDNQGLLDCHQSGNFDQTFVLKSEPVNPEDLVDDVSSHSGGSLSTGPVHHHHHHNLNSTAMSSLDEVEQHHLKLERKRARNRVAARRCRERKISLIRTLENQVAERDAHVKSLEETLARYRAEGERLRLHMEMLASSYPNLKAELYRIPFLFQQPSNHQSIVTQPSSSTSGVHSVVVDTTTDQSTGYLGLQTTTTQLTPLKTELSDNTSKHFS